MNPASTPGSCGARRVGVVSERVPLLSGRACWVLDRDRLARLLVLEGPGMLVSGSQRSLPQATPHTGVVPPGQRRCPECVAALLARDLAPPAPAGRWQLTLSGLAGTVMSGRHRRRPGLYVRIPEQRALRPVGIVDARTRVEHLIPGDVLAPHRLSYLAKCGVQIRAASLAEPGRGRCAECAR